MLEFQVSKYLNVYNKRVQLSAVPNEYLDYYNIEIVNKSHTCRAFYYHLFEEVKKCSTILT